MSKNDNKLVSKKESKLKAGVWQYMIDHASVADDKMFRIQFHVHSETDFWHRVKARVTGTYSRKDQVAFELHADVLRARREANSGVIRRQNRILNQLNHGTEVDKAKARVISKLTQLTNSLYSQ